MEFLIGGYGLFLCFFPCMDSIWSLCSFLLTDDQATCLPDEKTVEMEGKSAFD